MKLDGMSMDLEKTNMEKLRSVFPECFSEQKLDIDKLLSLCGEYIDNDFEKYKFEWKGKSECLRLAQKRSTGTLRPCREESVNFDDTENVYIEGDNLEVLKLLQTAYYNKIKMIYIDPPYNTGNDFVYEDDFADPMARYKEVTQQTTKSNPETMGRYHTNWLNMMYPRLRLAANLLRDDGVIFISIDEIEMPNLRKVCDEVFGEENHIADFVWHNKRGGGNDSKYVAVEHEYVLMYAKSINELSELFVPYSPDYIKRYKEEDEKGKYFWDTFKRKSGKQYYAITCPDGTVLEKDEFGNPISWLRSEARFYEDLKIGEVRIIKVNENWSVQFKQRIPEGKKPRTIFLEDSIFEQQGTTGDGSKEVLGLFTKNLFSNPKPINLIKHLLTFDTKDNDIILDFFSGSATTAHAVMQLNAEDGGNRKFIMVQLPELCDEKSEAYKAGYKNICEIGKERIRRAGKKILEEKGDQIAIGDEEKKPLDVGFKVFKLDTSNLKLWDNTPITGDDQIELFTERMNSMIDSIKDDRTDMDVVYEVMLKMGVPLDVPVQYIEINGKIVYIVGEFLLMIALFDNITAEDIESIAAYAPAKIICAESSFKDDSALSNAHYILRDKQIELKLV
jgi:adenine-specific DNA-methyltransferase